MKVLLIKDVKSLGKAGEVKEVKDGYGKNFLIAKGFAKQATPEVMNRFKAEQKRAKQKEQEQIDDANRLKEELDSTKLTIKHKLGANGHLIGSVTNKEISEALDEQFNIKVDKKNISLKNKIKAVGIYEVDCKLGHGISAKLKVDIIGE